MMSVKEEVLKQLEELTEEELKHVLSFIEKLKAQRSEGEEFYFQATNDPRKGVPFVAKITGVDEKGQLERNFVPLDRSYGKKSVTVSGYVRIKEGEIVEVRTGGSWKNDYRTFYLYHSGNFYPVADIDSSRDIARLKRYLKNEISLQELIEGLQPVKSPFKKKEEVAK